MTYNGMTSTEYMKIVYQTSPDFQRMYATVEDFLTAYAKHLAKKVKELGAEDRLDAKTRSKIEVL